MKRVGWMSAALWLLVSTAVAQDADEVASRNAGKAGGQRVAVPATHAVVEGDTLWDITQRYYGDPYKWPQVWSYNPHITNPHWIYPGATIHLRPAGEEVYVDLRAGRGPIGGAYGRGAILLTEYGFLDEDALQEAGYIIAANEEHMLMADTDMVYIRLEEGAKPNVGGIYTIYRKIEHAEREPDEKGTLVRIMGEVRLMDYDLQRQLGRAVIVQSLEPIERGYKVAPMQRSFQWVNVVPAEQSLRAQVVASLYPRKLPASNQMVFVDRGSENGVKVGNRFYIVRQGDEWRRSAERSIGREVETTVKLPKEPEHYPWEIVAVGRAVNVRPQTTAVWLEHATRAVRMGDYAELRQGE